MYIHLKQRKMNMAKCIDQVRYVLKCIDRNPQSKMYISTLLNKLYGEMLKHRDDIDINNLSIIVANARSYLIQCDLELISSKTMKCIIDILQKATFEYEVRQLGECLTMNRLNNSQECGMLTELPNDIQNLISQHIKISHPRPIRKLVFAD